MATALFISRDELVKFTALNGNIDADKFVQWVKVAQDIHIQNYLGTDLFNKINDGIVSGNLASPYTTLLTNYIKPMVIHWAMVVYLPQAPYTLSEKGAFKHSSENAETIALDEITRLTSHAEDIAQHYTRRFIDYMCNNSSLYPEYTSNSNGDVYPEKEADFGGWML